MIPDSKLTWFSFNPGEFLTRTVGLPNKDVGAFIKLLSYSWVNGPIPNDPRVLTSIAGKADMALITARFFEVNADGKLCDPRLEASRIEAAKLLEANRKRTAKASEKRWSSPSPSLDASVTETEDNDRTKKPQDPILRKPDSKNIGHARPDFVSTLPQEPSGTQEDEPSVHDLSNSSSGQKYKRSPEV